MKKELKTNVMRILEKEKVPYEAHYYQHGKEAVDGVTVAELTGQNPDYVFKTLVTVSNKKEYFVFVLPVAKELDLKKAAKAVNYRIYTRWLFSSRNEKTVCHNLSRNCTKQSGHHGKRRQDRNTGRM